MLKCPVCNEKSVKAYFSGNFTCSKCDSPLTSNLNCVTTWEGIAITFFLGVPYWMFSLLFGDAWYAEVFAFLPLVFACHFLLLSKLIEITPAIAPKHSNVVV